MVMNNEKLNTALYQKMEREQDKYRKWLVQCPPEEILSHAYEYVVREDILMSMEELNLPDDQATAESCAERKAAKDRNREAR